MRCTRRCGGRRRRRCNAGAGVVGVDHGLSDVSGRLRPKNRGGCLLVATDVEQQGVPVLLDVLDGGLPNLLGYLAVGFLQIALVGVGGVLFIALQLLFLDVQGALTVGALLVGGGGGQSLDLVLQRRNFRGFKWLTQWLGIMVSAGVKSSNLRGLVRRVADMQAIAYVSRYSHFDSLVWRLYSPLNDIC